MVKMERLVQLLPMRRHREHLSEPNALELVRLPWADWTKPCRQNENADRKSVAELMKMMAWMTLLSEEDLRQEAEDEVDAADEFEIVAEETTQGDGRETSQPPVAPPFRQKQTARLRKQERRSLEPKQKLATWSLLHTQCALRR
jgi:hypothetical protein